MPAAIRRRNGTMSTNDRSTSFLRMVEVGSFVLSLSGDGHTSRDGGVVPLIRVHHIRQSAVNHGFFDRAPLRTTRRGCPGRGCFYSAWSSPVSVRAYVPGSAYPSAELQ